MIKVRLTGFWDNQENLLFHFLNKYNNGKKEFKNIQFVLDSSYDKLVIFSKPNEDIGYYDYNKAMTIMTEPPLSKYINSHQTNYLCPMYLPLPSLPKTVFGYKKYGGNGDKITKEKLMSVVTSDLSFLEGHKKRLIFVSILDKVLGKNVNIFGRNVNGTFFKSIYNYKGALEDKYNGLWKYEYHFACENHFIENYFTEKILDPIIAECLCFYSGCTNVFEYIDERAFILIDIDNFDQSIEKIVRSINNKERQKKIKYIREQKLRLLTTLNPLNIIFMLVNEQDVVQKCKL